MNAQILGISGSPIKNSNTDRLIKTVLDASGLQAEFVKLSQISVRPCIACLGCKGDNICKVQDDFPALAEKVRRAGAIVVGGYTPYGSVDGFVKAFLERLFSLRHQNGLNRGKLAVAVTTGIGRGAPGLEAANDQIAHALTLEGMQVVGRLKAVGNPECMVCGHGETCPMSALPWVFGEDTKVTPEKFSRVEDQAELWEEAQHLGHEISRMLKGQLAMWGFHERRWEKCRNVVFAVAKPPDSRPSLRTVAVICAEERLALMKNRVRKRKRQVKDVRKSPVEVHDWDRLLELISPASAQMRPEEVAKSFSGVLTEAFGDFLLFLDVQEALADIHSSIRKRYQIESVPGVADVSREYRKLDERVVICRGSPAR